MGDIGVCLISAIIVFITVLSLIFRWLSYKANKMKASLNEDEGLIRYILLLEEAMKKLNKALRNHDRRLDDQLHELSNIKERLDILESGHPDSDIDYGEVDDDANVIAVWFNGKKYILEDKSDEDTVAFYADGKVASVETTRPEEKRCCATCKHYRPGSDHTCTIRYWLQVTNARANEAASVCNNYEKAYAATKGQVDYPYIHIPYGNGETDRIMKRVDELQCEIQRLNLIANMDCTAQELRQRWEELMRDDT